MNHSFCKTLLGCAICMMVFLIPLKSSAQWTFRTGFGNTTGTDRISGLATDASGNVYATGSYSGTFDPGTGLLPWTGNLDGFVAKFSPAGVCQWAIRFNGPGTAQDQGLGIATNGTSVFVGGVFQTSLSINGATAITGYGGIDGFGLKLDAATGATQWARVFGSGSTDAVQAMCIDNSGNMYATGYFSSNATFPTATFGSFTRSTNGVVGTDTYVAKLDGSTGAVVWVSTGGMATYNDNVSNSGLAYVPATDAVVMVGSMQSASAGLVATYSTASPASSLTLNSLGGLDIVVLKLNAQTGVYQSATVVGGPSNSNEEALAAAYDPFTGYVCLGGYFNTGALTFSGTTVGTYGSDDFFYAAFDPATNTFAWARSAGSTIQDRAQSMTTNGSGSVFMTGRFRNTLSAPTATTPLTFTSSRTSSADEIFMLEVNSSDGYAKSLVGPVGDNVINTGDIGTGIAATGNIVWVGGMYGGTVTFSPLSPLSTTGGTTADILLVRFAAAATLPLRLISFTASPVNNDVRLTWRTADEIDHDYFEIEKSTDGRTFTPIARQKGQPDGGAGSYTYTDIGAISNASGKIYYRLKMVSVIGHAEFSSTVTIDPGRTDTDLFLRGVSPNPFTGPLQATLYLKEPGLVKMILTDMTGRIIASNQVQLDAGATTIPVQAADQLGKGTFILSVEYKGRKALQKVIKR
jgi:hypothetical protein